MTLAALAAVIAFLPLLKPAGPGNTAPVDVFVALFLFTSVLGLLQRRRPLQLPAGTVLLVILVGSVLALIASVDVPTGLLTLLVDVYLFCLFIAVANELDTERALRLMLNVWVVTALVWATILIGGSLRLLPEGLQEFVGATQYATERSAGAAGNRHVRHRVQWGAGRLPRRRRHAGPGRLSAQRPLAGADHGADRRGHADRGDPAGRGGLAGRHPHHRCGRRRRAGTATTAGRPLQEYRPSEQRPRRPPVDLGLRLAWRRTTADHRGRTW